MLIRLFCGLALLASLSGCATTQAKNEREQLQTRVTELEKKIEEKDAEIVDLQYEVKDISSRVDNAASSTAVMAVKSDVPAPEAVQVIPGSNDVIRVNAPAQMVQTALKNAGVYTGKVDGKIGFGTKAAVVEFQKAHGLKADGIVGKKTWEELKTYLQ